MVDAYSVEEEDRQKLEESRYHERYEGERLMME